MVNAWEAMQKNTGRAGTAELQKPMQATQQAKDRQLCFRCGQAGHWQQYCQSKNTEN